jgi:hypothetical protein
MADLFIGIKRGISGTKLSDFTIGSSTTAAADFEIRIADTDDAGAPLTREDANLALKAFERYLYEGLRTTTGFPVL